MWGKSRLLLAGLLVVAVGFGVAWAKGDWSAAQSKAEDMKRKQMELRKLTPDEVRRVVEAVCNAEEEDRRDVGRDAADRVASKVSSELNNLERSRDDAYKAIDEVLADDELKANHDSAKRLREEVSDRWKSIERMARNAMRGANHPLVSFLILKGIEEHKSYQQSSSNCDAYEFETGSRRADCLKADGDTCYVIELKPNNSRARSKGERQARDSRDDLRRELEKGADKSDVLKKLFDRSSKFKDCKRWEYKLKCYSLCPPIDDEGEYREGSVSWSDC
jgi:hypothetical protein